MIENTCYKEGNSHSAEFKFQVQNDKSRTLNLIQRHAPPLFQLPCFPEGEGAAPREPALPPLHPLRPRGKHGGLWGGGRKKEVGKMKVLFSDHLIAFHLISFHLKSLRRIYNRSFLS